VELNQPKVPPIELDIPVGRTPGMAAPADHLHPNSPVVMRKLVTARVYYLLITPAQIQFFIDDDDEDGDDADAMQEMVEHYEKFSVPYVLIRI
jgi:hypothetical protein